MPYRELYWNIILPRLVEVLFLPFLFIFLFGIWRRWQGWRLGGPSTSPGHISLRLKRLFRDGFLQIRLARDSFAGMIHLSLFWGMVILFVATILVAAQAYLGIPVLYGRFYLYFMSLVVDLFGVLAIVGCVLALIRRYGMRTKRVLAVTPEARYGFMVGLLLTVLITGYLLEGLRIAATRDPWGLWSFGGWLVSRILTPWPSESLLLIHRWLWWGHALLAFTWIALLPFTGLLHSLTAPLIIFLRPSDPPGSLAALELRKVQKFGVGKIEHFPMTRLLELDACTECGRCEEDCPAWATGKPLSPRRIVLSLRALVRDGRRRAGELLVGPVVSEDAIWSCTTCGACAEACPVWIDPLEKILEMRRYATMELMRVPQTIQEALLSLEDRGHPFRGTAASRTEWAERLNVQFLNGSGHYHYDVLYWPGCAGSLDPRGQSISRAVVRVLRAAGVAFAIMGEDAQCCGHFARRMGHEYLFEILARRNIEIFRRSGFPTIVTSCPHCYYTFAHEYPQLGVQFTAKHHTQFISDLLSSDKLRLARPLEEVVVFHDPCYLGRIGGDYSSPREVLGAVPGICLLYTSPSPRDS